MSHQVQMPHKIDRGLEPPGAHALPSPSMGHGMAAPSSAAVPVALVLEAAADYYSCVLRIAASLCARGRKSRDRKGKGGHKVYATHIVVDNELKLLKGSGSIDEECAEHPSGKMV